jgi:hypothetical protein
MWKIKSLDVEISGDRENNYSTSIHCNPGETGAYWMVEQCLNYTPSQYHYAPTPKHLYKPPAPLTWPDHDLPLATDTNCREKT